MKCDKCGMEIQPGEYVAPMGAGEFTCTRCLINPFGGYFMAVMGSDGKVRWSERGYLKNRVVEDE